MWAQGVTICALVAPELCLTAAAAALEAAACDMASWRDDVIDDTMTACRASADLSVAAWNDAGLVAGAAVTTGVGAKLPCADVNLPTPKP